jgi:hypothetical protein
MKSRIAYLLLVAGAVLSGSCGTKVPDPTAILSSATCTAITPPTGTTTAAICYAVNNAPTATVAQACPSTSTANTTYVTVLTCPPTLGSGSFAQVGTCTYNYPASGTVVAFTQTITYYGTASMTCAVAKSTCSSANTGTTVTSFAGVGC